MILKDKVYGDQKVNDPLIIELLNSPEMQRLKGVGQYSTWKIINPKLDTTRFEHSFGVYCLLKRFGSSYEEQIAGLLHDINHTAFSHVADYVFGDPSTQEYSDLKQKEILMSSSIPKILAKKGLNTEKIADHHGFGLLDRDLPDLCCDRIDYCLRDALTYGLIDHNKANKILNGLIVHNKEIICKDRESAYLITKTFFDMSNLLWSNEVQAGSFLLLAEALKLALKKGIIKESDFYTTDDVLLEKLKSSGNEKILNLLSSIKKDSIFLGTKEDYTIYSKSKARYIDPKFIENEKIIRLSEVDAKFKKEIDNFKEIIKKGFYIKVKL